jgi:hypothetical protein
METGPRHAEMKSIEKLGYTSTAYRTHIWPSLTHCDYQLLPAHLLRDCVEQHYPAYDRLNPQGRVCRARPFCCHRTEECGLIWRQRHRLGRIPSRSYTPDARAFLPARFARKPRGGQWQNGYESASDSAAGGDAFCLRLSYTNQ